MPYPLAATHSRRSFQSAVSIPPIPSSANAVLAISTLGNWLPGTYAGNAASVNGDGTPEDAVFTVVAPFPIDWDALVAGGDPPYYLDELNDQS